jgi:hypothetical protein
VEQEQQTPGNRIHSFIGELVPDWRPTREQMLWMIRIVIVLVGLLGILTLIGSAFGITLWDWLKLLIIPAVVAGGTLWFNQNQQARHQEQQEHNEIVEALQGEKESGAYVAVQVREEGLPNDKERRAQILTALYLAMLFQQADRTRALVFSALRDSYHKGHGEEVMETLCRLKDDFTRYKEELAGLKEKDAYGIEIDKHIKRLEVLEEALKKSLPEPKEMSSVSQETKEPK